MFGTLAFAQAPFSAAPAAAGPVTHSTTGTLTGPSSTLSGTANRSRAFTASGTLTGPGSTVTGSSARFRVFDTTGTLTGPGATLTGSATLNRAHGASGVLTGSGAIIVGSAVTLVASYPDPSDVRAGVQYGPGGIYVGTLTVGQGEATIALRSFTGRF